VPGDFRQVPKRYKKNQLPVDFFCFLETVLGMAPIYQMAASQN
jgi:hypothetical protein